MFEKQNALISYFYRMTKYVAMDCEMDLLTRENPINPGFEPYKEYQVCKISLVNQDGEIILDTLVDYRKKGINTAEN